jgi:hypothetical protein
MIQIQVFMRVSEDLIVLFKNYSLELTQSDFKPVQINPR